MKKTGFTIAEVLITLGIIGVVAVLTLSSLSHKYQEKVVVNQVVKTYTVLNEAFQLAINDYGTVDNWCQLDQYEGNGYPTCSEKMRDILSKYLNVAKICTGWPYANQCMAGDAMYTSAQGEKNKINYAYNNYFKSMQLLNGMGVNFDSRNYGNGHGVWCKHNTDIATYSEACGVVSVDINGDKGPNRDGVDLFAFIIYRNGLYGHGRKGIDNIDPSFKHSCLKKTIANNIDQGRGSCTAWVLQNKNLDYLHCPEKLGWDKAKSCKE